MVILHFFPDRFKIWFRCLFVVCINATGMQRTDLKDLKQTQKQNIFYLKSDLWFQTVCQGSLMDKEILPTHPGIWWETPTLRRNLCLQCFQSPKQLSLKKCPFWDVLSSTPLLAGNEVAFYQISFHVFWICRAIYNMIHLVLSTSFWR